MEQILYGKPVAERLDEYSSKIFKTFESEQIKPKLTAITVGDNPASILYVSRKQEKAIKLGVDETVINAYSETPKTGIKLVPDNGNKAKQVFTK